MDVDDANNDTLQRKGYSWSNLNTKNIHVKQEMIIFSL